jgi:hypothetical protein
MTIFCFGGFLGSAISLIPYKCKQTKNTFEHLHYKAGKFTYSLSGIGCLFCRVFISVFEYRHPNIYNL